MRTQVLILPTADCLPSLKFDSHITLTHKSKVFFSVNKNCDRCMWSKHTFSGHTKRAKKAERLNKIEGKKGAQVGERKLNWNSTWLGPLLWFTNSTTKTKHKWHMGNYSFIVSWSTHLWTSKVSRLKQHLLHPNTNWDMDFHDTFRSIQFSPT